MYVQPNSTIKLYHNVPLDNTYEHTLYFDSLSSQNNYFHGNADILTQTFTANSYQRVNKGKMRISAGADSLYNCNYLSFQNTNFGQKWFYAFILELEYVNNSVSEVTYEIDAMQTYFFDVELKETFVEREHVSDDTIGANILPEPVQLGDYIQYGSDVDLLDDTLLKDNAIIVACAERFEPTIPPDYTNPQGQWVTVQGAMISEVYQGLDFNAYYGVNALATVNAFLIKATQENKQDTIVSIFMCPKFIVDSWQNGLSNITISNKRGTDFDGYTPKNNKLFTYPYNLLYATAGDGKFTQYRFEWFDNPNSISFKRMVQLSCTASAGVSPLGYKHGWQHKNLYDSIGDTDVMLTIDNFPVCSYTIDSFRAWLAQNQYNLASSLASGFIGAGVNTAGGSPVGAINGLIKTGTEMATNIMNATLLPDQNRGNATNNNLLFSNGFRNIVACRKGIQKDYAIAIDNYFTKYGYACERVKIPNRNVRTNFTYTKTRNCVIRGNCPADDIRKMCDVYDKGITFWNNPANVGNYSITNSPS